MKQIASFGCGVDSVAMVLLKPDYDEIIFADTGSEMPETYAFLDYFEKKSGLKITTVKSKEGNIYDYFTKGKDSKTLFECACFNG
jgi:3'-phosphoadenosine 5'-phosphosulfate sulfotransferase (PAPS reductase)/FAD synthetase|tara:strand:+ start:244 stop:498 length:255 start_codon:yes stop_codon:yes gene_type:complete